MQNQLLLTLTALLALADIGRAQTTAVTYQGRLAENDVPVTGLTDFEFRLFDDASAGTQVGLTLTRDDWGVTNGLFTVTLDFGNLFATGAERWLSLAVRPGASNSAYTALSPRQRITATPYAVRALSAGSAGSATTATTVTAGGVNNLALASDAVDGAKILNGSITSADLNTSLVSGTFWNLGGNAGTTPGTQFIGTTDNRPTEFKVNGSRALRLEPTANGTPNLIAGAAVNSVSAGVFGVTISGGGNNLAETGTEFATIGGGQINAIRAGGHESIIGGGYRNTIETFDSTIGGGAVNTIQTNSQYSTIAGGTFNRILAGAALSTIGGGSGNLIESNAPNSAIPGGVLNTAAGPSSFAAGYRAKAMHQGSFVWADSLDADFTSTATNQFLIRAAGGVGINNNNPNGAALAVNGDVTVNGVLTGNGAGLTNVAVVLDTLSSGAISLAGGFFLSSSPVVASSPYSVAAADVNGDGKVDLISANTFGNTLSVLTNNGNAGFVLALTRSVGNRPYSVISADVTGDGWVDLVAVHSAFPGLLLVWRNNGNGSFAPSFPVEVGNLPESVIAADVNGDGKLDLITANAGATTLSVLINAPAFNGTFSGSGAGLTNLAAASLTGTLTDAQIDSLDAAKITSGTLADARLTANVALRGGGNAFTGNQTMTGGNVGLGTTSPQTALHVYSASSPTTLRVQSSAQPGAGRLEFLSDPQGSGSEWRPGYIQSTDNGGFAGGLSFVVNGSGFENRFGEVETMRVVNGRVGIGTPSPVSALQVIGTVTATAFNPPSDRNLKENFAPVSPREVLEKVAALPISRWNFKGDSATPHVGPMAQDFHAAFGVGTDDKHIATVDADGVALAAIQGLNQKVEDTRAENAELKRELSEITQLLSKLSHLTD